MATMTHKHIERIAKPSFCLDALAVLVRRRIIKRGFARLLANLPNRVWGGRYVCMPTEAGAMVFDVKDKGTMQMMLHGRARHEELESAVVRILSSRFGRVVDIGANIGWYPRLITSSNPEIKRVLALEPHPAVCKLLTLNCREYNAIDVRNQAVGDENGEIAFWCSPESNLSSSVRKVGREVKVRQTTLDAVAGDLGLLGQIDFVKCDVEGAEYKVLLGSRSVRRAAMPPIWMLEIEAAFLAASSITVEDIEKEMLACGTGRWFMAGSRARLTEIEGPSAATRSNVFFVPESRMKILSGIVS